MDHLPPVSKPHKPIAVPYLGGVYDNKNFARYPNRQNLDVGRLQQGDLQGASAADVESFLQAWLFFGMMMEFMDMEIEPTDFLRTDDSNEKYITTERLPQYLQRFRKQVEQEDAAADCEIWSAQRNERIRECMNLSLASWDATIRLMRPQVSLSIHVLGITLQESFYAIKKFVQVLPWKDDQTWTTFPNQFMTRLMLDDGWCPSVIEQLAFNFNAAAQYYARLLGPPHRREDHRFCSEESRGCNAKNVVETDYATTHTEEGCRCKVHEVDSAKAQQIIEAGSIPVVYLDYKNSTRPLQVIAFDLESDLCYTAVSHVWADGLGNPGANTLPECQLRKLDKLFYALQFEQSRDDTISTRARKADHLYFWMDTLCVPIKPQAARDEAIKKMRFVYGKAERVLVLDADLMNATVDASYEEIQMRIACSTWIRRLWTLQEASLPKEVFFQFAERAVSITTGSRIWKTRQMDDGGERLYNFIGRRCKPPAFRFESFQDWPVQQRMLLVWSAVQNRSTTRRGDETLALAIFLNNDLRDLLKAPVSEKIKIFWDLNKELVCTFMLFLPGKKSEIEGLGWSPESVLECGRFGNRMSQQALLTPEGLSFRFPPFSAFVIGRLQSPTGLVISCKLGGETHYVYRNDYDGVTRDLEAHQYERLAVIVEQEPPANSTHARCLSNSLAALVSLVRETENSLFTKYIRLVNLIQKNAFLDKHPKIPWSDQAVMEKNRVPVEAAWIDQEKLWFIG